MKENRCICCGNLIEGQRCEYCGFINIAALDETAEKRNLKEAQRYCKRLVEKITDISIVSNEYIQEKGEDEFKLLGTEVIKLADGMDCFGSIFWTRPEFGQYLSPGEITGTFELSYRFNGKEKKVKCAINPVQCDSYWHIGLEITKELRLVVYLGGKKKYAKSRPMDLDLL